MEKRRIETSKKIILASYVSAAVLSVIVVIATFAGYDASNITTIASLAWAEVAASNIYYMKKSAKENVPKVIASLPSEFRDQIDVNLLLNQ